MKALSNASLKRGLALAALFLGIPPCVSAQETVTLRFDISGAESGVTTRGTRTFSFMGSNWNGGVVNSRGVFPLYASGTFSYEIDAAGGQVTFDDPVDSARFFYVHGFGLPSGTATAFNSEAQPVASANSRQATSFGDSSNFVLLDSGSPHCPH